MGQGERMYAEKHLIPQTSPHAVGRGGHHPRGAGAVCGDIRGKPCPGMMNFWCEPLRLSPVAPDNAQDRSPGRWALTADRPIVPETDVRLLNWTVSSRVSILSVGAYGLAPSPHNPDPEHDGTEQGSLPVANSGMPSWEI